MKGMQDFPKGGALSPLKPKSEKFLKMLTNREIKVQGYANDKISIYRGTICGRIQTNY